MEVPDLGGIWENFGGILREFGGGLGEFWVLGDLGILKNLGEFWRNFKGI